MRNMFAETFYHLAREDARLCLAVADISPAGSIQAFREAYPERFINTGVAEQVMIGLCAGLALRGLRPFAYTIATFALFRPFEMVRDDLCYQNLPVTVVGIGGGLTYSTLGGTHQALEDIAIASALPHMQVIAPCDPDETRAATIWCAQQTLGPAYVRLGKAGEPRLTADAEEPWTFGRIRRLRPGAQHAILAYGTIMKLAIDLTDALRDAGVMVAVYSVHTLKPLDRARLAEILCRYDHVVTIEESVPAGSLGVQVKALAQEMSAGCRIDAFALQDRFIHNYGTHADLLAAHGLTVPLIRQVFGC